MGIAMIKYKLQQGLTLIEALVSTAIVGIGFVAIFSMVNFSVQSIDSSAERTKANNLVSMIAEDIIGHRNTIHGVNMETENIGFNAEGKPIKLDDTGTEVSSLNKFSEHLVDNNFEIDNAGKVCADKSDYANKDDIENLYVSEKEGHRIRKIVIFTGVVTTVAGKGQTGNTNATGTDAMFRQPWDVTTDGKDLYVADSYNYLIRKID